MDLWVIRLRTPGIHWYWKNIQINVMILTLSSSTKGCVYFSMWGNWTHKTVSANADWFKTTWAYIKLIHGHMFKYPIGCCVNHSLWVIGWLYFFSFILNLFKCVLLSVAWWPWWRLQAQTCQFYFTTLKCRWSFNTSVWVHSSAHWATTNQYRCTLTLICHN